MHDISDDNDKITRSKNEKWKEHILSVKGITKEHKNTEIRNIRQNKKDKLDLFHPVKNPIYVLCSTEKKLNTDQ